MTDEKNELAVPESAKQAAIHTGETEFDVVAQSSGFLPFLFICAKTSDLIDEGKAKGGNVILKNGQNITDLGPEISGLVLAWRFRAMEFGDDILSSFDPKSKEFQAIKAKADDNDQGASYGIEFLIYSPSIQPGGFVLYLMGNNSSRREAPSMRAIYEEWKDEKHDRKIPAMNLKSYLHKGRKYSWYIPQITVCSTPIEPMPESEEMTAQIENFNNPPKDEREKIEKESTTADGATRER